MADEEQVAARAARLLGRGWVDSAEVANTVVECVGWVGLVDLLEVSLEPHSDAVVAVLEPHRRVAERVREYAEASGVDAGVAAAIPTLVGTWADRTLQQHAFRCATVQAWRSTSEAAEKTLRHLLTEREELLHDLVGDRLLEAVAIAAAKHGLRDLLIEIRDRPPLGPGHARATTEQLLDK